MNHFLIVPTGTKPYVSEHYFGGSHILGRVADGKLKIFQYKSGHYWQLVVRKEENRWVEDWILLFPPK